jgi:hypothetical protein
MPYCSFHRFIHFSLSAILVVNVIGGMLEPARSYLSQLCLLRPESSSATAKKKEE